MEIACSISMTFFKRLYEVRNVRFIFTVSLVSEIS